jgi:predicted nucleic acid-binding protein
MGRLTLLMRTFYLDACGIIDLHEKANGANGLGRAPGLLRELFGWATRGWCKVITSELSLAECLVEPLRAGAIQPAANEDAQRRATWYSNSISLHGSIPAMPISRDVLQRAAELRARQRSIKLPDAIHLASAEASRAETFVTRDNTLTRLFDPDRSPIVSGISLAPASEQWLEHTLSDLRPR